VQLRYELPSPRDQHVRHYDALIAYLQSVPFEFVPPLEELPATDREDPTKNVLTGLVRSANVPKLLAYGDIASVLLTPVDYKLPEDPATRVKVRLELTSGLGTPRQRDLADQTRLLLGELAFHEAVGYDTRGFSGRPFTRLVGTIPAGQVATLLKDLRGQPSGWFAPRFDFSELPLPLRALNPILVTEVVPEPEPAKELAETPARPRPDLEKISTDLWPLVSEKGREAKVVRLEIILAYDPADAQSWQQDLAKAAPGLLVEGRLGPVVTATARLGQVPALAAVPVVSVLRLPRPARGEVDGAVRFPTDNAAALRQSGIEAFHQLGYRGKAVRLAVLDSDFRGYQALVRAGKLPARTRLVDLTTERNPDLFPDAWPGDPKAVGQGTQCALAAVLAAPDVDLTLIRIDPAALYQVWTAARYIAGDSVSSLSLGRRLDELARDRAALAKRREELRTERRFVLQSFEDETEYQRAYGILGPVRAWVFSDREWQALRNAEWERDAAGLSRREQRYLRLVEDLGSLRDIQLVTSALVWNDGYPLGGASPLSRAFDDTPGCPALYFQSAGNTRGQSWAGPFRDQDGNGVLEFAPPGTPLPAGRWTAELNFLGWQPFEAAATPDLPDGTKVRVSLQWREPHDPSLFFRPGTPDLYRQPLAELRLVILRQRDPQAKTLPADDFEVVARSSGWPQRLANHPASSSYEQSVEFAAVQGARYAVRVERPRATRWVIGTDPRTGRPVLRQLERLVPTGIRPLGAATLPALEKHWELRPRLFVEAVAGSGAGLGRPVFADFPTDVGSIGVPADAHQVIAVGAADLSGKVQPYSAKGPPANLELLRKPDVLAFDGLGVAPEGNPRAYGTSLATPFAAGLAATLRSAGASPQRILHLLQAQPGQVFRVAPPRTAAAPRHADH
jgi:hypothetical protein